MLGAHRPAVREFVIKLLARWPVRTRSVHASPAAASWLRDIVSDVGSLTPPSPVPRISHCIGSYAHVREASAWQCRPREASRLGASGPHPSPCWLARLPASSGYPARQAPLSSTDALSTSPGLPAVPSPHPPLPGMTAIHPPASRPGRDRPRSPRTVLSLLGAAARSSCFWNRRARRDCQAHHLSGAPGRKGASPCPAIPVPARWSAPLERTRSNSSGCRMGEPVWCTGCRRRRSGTTRRGRHGRLNATAWHNVNNGWKTQSLG